MSSTTSTTTATGANPAQTTTPGTPGADPATGTGQAPPSSTTTDATSTDPGRAGGQDALLADLAKERDRRQEMEKSLQALQAQQQAIAAAFGVNTDGQDDPTAAVTEQLAAIQKRLDDAERAAALLAAADEHKIPAEYRHLLTATDPEALAQQAKAVGELVAKTTAAAQTPGFASSAGQGNNGSGTAPTLAQQIATAQAELAKHPVGSEGHRAALATSKALKAQQLAALNGRR